MLRTVVTLKNLCVKYQRGMLEADAGRGGAAGLLGGFNPVIPNAMGSFVDDIYVAMFKDLLNLYDQTQVRRVKVTQQEITFP